MDTVGPRNHSLLTPGVEDQGGWRCGMSTIFGRGLEDACHGDFRQGRRKSEAALWVIITGDL